MSRYDATEPRYDPRASVLFVSLDYVFNILWPVLAITAGMSYAPSATWVALLLGGGAWVLNVLLDGAELRTGRPDEHFSRTHWVFCRLREYLSLTLHRTAECQAELLRAHPTGQAIFAFFPHGVNSDFRVLMDGCMYDAFAGTYKKSPGRTLAASILFKLPGIRTLALKTACVDAGKATAQRCLRAGHSLLLCPGGQDEQIETIFGRERVFLKRRAGFVRLALEANVPVVPCFCFGSSDLYFTSRVAHGLRRWLVRNLRISLPIYTGDWGLFAYPTPKGFPRTVAQHIVFGQPLVFPKREEVSAKDVEEAHAQFIAALTALFDEHKAAFGYAGRTLEVL